MTTSSATTIADVTHLISHLGGPRCPDEDLQWAADIPAGNKILQWVASQASDAGTAVPVLVAKRCGHNRDLHDEVYENALSPVGLYQEEVDMLGRLRQASGHDEPLSSHATSPTIYALPSTLKRVLALEREAEILEARAARLQHRSNMAKTAAKDSKRAKSVVRKSMEESDRAAQTQQERLTELSVEVDSVIGRCTQQAQGLLQFIREQDDKLSTLKAHVASIDRARTSLSDTIARLYRALDAGYASLPDLTQLQTDAGAVHACLSAAAAGAGAQRLIAAAYLEELERVARQVEECSQGGKLDCEELTMILQDVPERSSGAGATEQLVPNVKAELERAGHLDRLLLLESQERGLDVALSRLQDDLLPRLQRTYDVLHARGGVAVETEAVVSALIEELEDANDAVVSAKRAGAGADDSGGVLEDAVMELLKAVLRSGQEDRPTVLLNRSDLDAELAALKGRSAASRKAEAKWAAELPQQLAALYVSHSRAPLLTAAYENAPMNTSAPFAPPPDEIALRNDVRGKASELMQAAARLQKESELSSRDKRKVMAFVEKWSSR
ncbi:hypothetical protein BD413DRAFT_472172 [Trametes elegans]|nr:hypothetical protein BD413DRAFT_472172 [Trametes elegans]